MTIDIERHSDSSKSKQIEKSTTTHQSSWYIHYRFVMLVVVLHFLVPAKNTRVGASESRSFGGDATRLKLECDRAANCPTRQLQPALNRKTIPSFLLPSFLPTTTTSSPSLHPNDTCPCDCGDPLDHLVYSLYPLRASPRQSLLLRH
jgi:hypothetical protein